MIGGNMDETIRQAHERLSAAFREIGYPLAPTTGVIEGIKVHDRQGRYLFSWHTHPHHLLFYIRQPALGAQSTLRQKAMSRHPAEQVTRNPGNETTITLKSDEEAQTLLGWLKP